MENLKSFISKKIISLQGEKLGYILNGIVDNELKNFIGFVVVDDESEEEFLLEFSRVYSCGENCVMIESEQSVKPLILLSNYMIIGKDVYSDDGVFLGKIRDIIFNSKGVRKIVCEKAEIMARQVASVGNGCVIVGKKKQQKNTFPKNGGFDRKVQISQIKQIKKENNEIQKPIKLMGNINVIVGKMMKEDLIGLNNEIIAKKGEKINKKIINKALAHGKGNLLFFLSE